MPATIYLAVTNTLIYDQRMTRICTSLQAMGYDVVLVGRKAKLLPVLQRQSYRQVRLNMRFQKGKLFYAEYNLRLFFFLLLKKMNTVCAIDLDTILPCLLISKLKNIPRVYDAHELFTEMKEVISRPAIHRFWLWVEKKSVPAFKYGYTVNGFIADEMKRRYGVQYSVIRNLPFANVKTKEPTVEDQQLLASLPPTFFLYQGAVNEGRSFETLIPAMQQVAIPLVIAGDGNFMDTVKELIRQYGVENKVMVLGAVAPGLLQQLTPKAWYGLTLFESTGLNQYYSLANRFFDYIQAGIPQLCVNYPEYEAVNRLYRIAYLINDLSPASLADTLNKLAVDRVLYEELQSACAIAAQALCWENEEERLKDFYKKLSI